MKLSTQHPLGLSIRGDDDLDCFIGPTPSLTTELGEVLAGPDQQFHSVFVYGPSGSGKTHLLNGLARRHLSLDLPVEYINPDHFRIADQAPPDNFPERTLVVCDDVDGYLATLGWEDSLWSLYMSIESQGLRLLCSAKAVPRQTFTRADLGSRIAGHLVFALKCLDGDDLRQMLRDKIERRGLSLGVGVLDYILNHISRKTDRLDRVVASIDELSQVRRTSTVTVPLLKQLLGDT